MNRRVRLTEGLGGISDMPRESVENHYLGLLYRGREDPNQLESCLLKHSN